MTPTSLVRACALALLVLSPLAAEAQSIDAAVEFGNGKAFFFRGSEYIRYDLRQDKADPGFPKPIAGNWKGVWKDGIDAGFLGRNGKVYLFRGAQYLRFDIKADATDSGYPKPIAGSWKGLPWEDGIEAAFEIGGKA